MTLMLCRMLSLANRSKGVFCLSQGAEAALSAKEAACLPMENVFLITE